MKKLFLIMIGLAFLACGQDSHLVEGKITNNSGQSIDSVLVQVMGTDLNRGEELIFSKKGYEMHRLQIEGRSKISVELQTEE